MTFTLVQVSSAIVILFIGWRIVFKTDWSLFYRNNDFVIQMILGLLIFGGVIFGIFKAIDSSEDVRKVTGCEQFGLTHKVATVDDGMDCWVDTNKGRVLRRHYKDALDHESACLVYENCGEGGRHD